MIESQARMYFVFTSFQGFFRPHSFAILLHTLICIRIPSIRITAGLSQSTRLNQKVGNDAMKEHVFVEPIHTELSCFESVVYNVVVSVVEMKRMGYARISKRVTKTEVFQNSE
jgi:hypothetical protein